MSQNTVLDEQGNYIPGDFDLLVKAVQESLDQLFEDYPELRQKPIFYRTSLGKETLWNTYLKALPEEERNYHRCWCCQAFIENYADYVFIRPGEVKTRSVFWNIDTAKVPEIYQDMVKIMNDLVTSQKVTGIDTINRPVIGSAPHGGWTHFQINAPIAPLVGFDLNNEEGRLNSIYHERFLGVVRGMTQWSYETINKAYTLIASGALYKSEMMGQWIFLIRKLFEDVKTPYKNNALWKAAVEWPVGWHNFNNGLMGFLLEKIQEKEQDDATAWSPASDDEIVKAFNYQADPSRYRMQQEKEFSEKQIAEANKKIIAAGLADSLERRYARYDELPKIWERPQAVVEPKETKPAGPFDVLKEENRKSKDVFPTTSHVPTTLAVFKKKYLPTLVDLRVRIPMMIFVSLFTTQKNPEAKPLFRWDLEEKRNPFSLITLVGQGFTKREIAPIPANLYGLNPGEMISIKGIVRHPSRFTEEGAKMLPEWDRYYLVMDHLFDALEDHQGIGLFPAYLKGGLKELESIIWTYSEKQTMVPEGKLDMAALNIVNTPIEVTYMDENGYRVKTNLVIDREE